jgi:hypothetical protein
MGDIMTDIILKFGVLDIPYGDAKSYREVKRKKPKTIGGSATTGDVAEILEARYNIMEFFWTLYGDKIGDALLNSMEGAAESILLGAPATLDPYGSATAEIETLFRTMLTEQKMDGQPGVATEAAKEGVSHRFKQPYKKRPPRPSFIDTSLFEASFRAWVDDDE